MTKTAIEKAEKLRQSSTSDEEDAMLIAQLIHGLGSDRTAAKYERIANGRKVDAPFERQVRTPAGITIVYNKRDDGKAKTPDGDSCTSYEQQLELYEQGEHDLWAQAEEEQLTRQVEKALLKVQEAEERRRKRVLEGESANGASGD